MKEHKLAAIVFTDIVGYTSRMEKDEQHTMELLKKQRDIIFPLVKEYGGEVIKEIGDGLLMMFTSAVKAVRFAIAVQNRLDDEELTIRAGIHIGDVIFEEGDVYGSAVNIAARIEPLAPSGGICISEDVNSQIRNKEDINTTSIGNKALKGVNEQIEIFRIVMDNEIPESTKPVPFFKDLWSRRVFQITAIYLILAWLIRMAMSAIVDQYLLSPYLIDLAWFILLALIPSVILVSYFHGKKGVTKWTRVELIGMPLNIILAILVMVFVFKGKDLGAATTSLKMENEDGEIIEHVIVKNEFRKKIALFNLKNISGDESLNYLQYTIPTMTEYDLSQDLFITAESAVQFFRRLVEAGFPDGVGLPLTLMQKLSEQFHLNYFLTGELDYSNDKYILKYKLYETAYTNLISEFKLENDNVFALVDELTIKVKESMNMPASHIKETNDLPISEIFTGSMEAIQYFSSAAEEMLFNNYEEAINYMKKAIEEDPGFAIAHMTLSIYYVNASQFDKASAGLQTTMDYLYKLPERQQFFVKYLYYILNQEPEKALAVVKMWVEFYPDDIQGRSTLAERYMIKNMNDEAIAEYKEILRIDPERYETLNTIGVLYLRLGVFDSSLTYFQKYADLFPEQRNSYTNLGDFHATTGDMEKARENYEKAFLLASVNEKVPIIIDIANIELNSGEYKKALSEYENALSYCKNGRDSVRVFASLKTYYLLKGQNDLALEYQKKRIEAMKSHRSPKDLYVMQTFTIDAYMRAGEDQEGLILIKKMEDQLEPPLDKIIPLGYLLAYAEQGDAEKAEEYIPGVEELIKAFGEEIMVSNLYYAQGKIAEIREQYEPAIEYYTKYLELNPTNYDIHHMIARNYRKLKKFRKAENHIEIGMVHNPYNPEHNLEAALLYYEMGESDKALEQLELAILIWKDADEDYKPASEANEKLVEWTSD